MSDVQDSWAEHYQVIIDAAPSALLMVDGEGLLVLINRAAERLFGYGRDELLGQPIERLVPDRFRDKHPHLRNAYLAKPTSRAMGAGRDLLARRRDGSEFPVEIGLNPVETPEGLFVLSAVVDLTERKQLEQSQISAREAAEAAVNAKSAFLANMSHEIRTPLNGIIGMAGLLSETWLDLEQQEYASGIRNSGDALLSIINQVLDVSKLDAGGVSLEKAPFDVVQCVESAMDLVATQAGERGLELIGDVDDEVPRTLVGDSARVRQVLVNLLGNAIKFTESGEIALTVVAHLTGDHRWRAIFSVRDTGIGLDADQMERIFEAFSQADVSTTRRFGGTGLGLFISRQLVELMGGQLRAESDGAGRGSTFHVEIELEGPTQVASTASPADTRMLVGKRVLVVDDNQTNRIILRRQTRSWGMVPVVVGSGAEALLVISDEAPFDVAILDLAMPDMDGAMVAAALQHRLGDATPPLLLLSSVGILLGESMRDKFRQILTKPIKPLSLRRALCEVWTQAGPGEGPSSAGSAFDPELGRRRPLRILVAEDNLVNQQVAIRMLERLGYDADLAANGLEVLAALRRRSYDLILMDINMPEMDGLEASRHIRQEWPRQRRPRIVAITARLIAEDREAFSEAGIVDIVAKPMRVEALVNVLEGTRPLGAAAENPSADCIETVDDPEATAVEGAAPEQLDLAPLRHRLGEGPEGKTALVRVLESFLRQAPTQMSALRDAVQQENRRPAVRAAHSLRSSLRHLGVPGLAQTCADMEDASRLGDFGSVRQGLKMLGASLGDLLAQTQEELTRLGGAIVGSD